MWGHSINIYLNELLHKKRKKSRINELMREVGQKNK